MAGWARREGAAGTEFSQYPKLPEPVLAADLSSVTASSPSSKPAETQMFGQETQSGCVSSSQAG